jgi:hypothetical protein
MHSCSVSVSAEPSPESAKLAPPILAKPFLNLRSLLVELLQIWHQGGFGLGLAPVERMGGKIAVGLRN